MFWRTKLLYNAIAGWASRTTQISNRVDLERLECLSPIDRYVVCSGIFNNQALFDPVYEDWRIKRLNKMLEIYGIDYFKGRKILELGGGHGDIGAFFAELGADVLSLDGRIQNVNFARLKHLKVANLRFAQFNLEHNFSSFGRFDLIINFGLLYHLKDVENHLKCCFSVADDIILETVVCDSSDPDKIVLCQERSEIEQAAAHPRSTSRESLQRTTSGLSAILRRTSTLEISSLMTGRTGTTGAVRAATILS
jgi:SAM-dependent methyltransferase